MALGCEVCGAVISGLAATVEIDGAFLRVCNNCSKRGVPVRTVRRVRVQHKTFRTFRIEEQADVEVDPEYPSLIRKGREKLGLTHEQLGRATSEKPSMISHLETGKMKPNIQLAKKLMHQLRINLLVASSELDSSDR